MRNIIIHRLTFLFVLSLEAAEGIVKQTLKHPRRRFMSPFLVASLFSACFIKLTDSLLHDLPQKCDNFIKCFSCILLCFSFTSCLSVSSKGLV